MTTLTRASVDLTTDGRTLEGLAYYYDRASKVSDGGRPYLEAFTRTAADKSIKQRSAFPVFRSHDYSRDPIGVVSFEPSDEGLIFRAPLSKTRDADETLELVNDGAMRSVSVAFRDLHSLRRTTAEGIVTVRTEIALRELSVAPTGFGQHVGAEVLAVRTEQDEEGTPRLDALRRRRSLLVVSW